MQRADALCLHAKGVWLAHVCEKGLENGEGLLTLDSSKMDMSGLACFIPIFAEGLAKVPPAHVRRTKYSARAFLASEKLPKGLLAHLKLRVPMWILTKPTLSLICAFPLSYRF